MIKVILKKNREKPVRQRHPWIFSGAIDKVEGAIERGCPCAVYAFGREYLGEGYFNPDSSIAVRMTLFGKGAFDDAALIERIKTAVAARKEILDNRTTVFRLVNSEGDFLPGLIVDRYAEGLCVQILTAGMERRRTALVKALVEFCQPAFIYERSDAEARQQEGLEPAEGCLYGESPGPLVVAENGLKFEVDPAHGQKTGFYSDQRVNRALLASYAADRAVCDCFCYSGGFTCNALAGGARTVLAVDASGPAIETAGRNVSLNGFDAGRCSFQTADVFGFLRSPGRTFDCIILDPPKFARHQADVEKAARGYKDINLLAMRNMAPGGLLFTFSCSQAIDRKLFRQIAFAAATDSGRSVQVLHTLSQPADHPVDIAHLEGEYLKGLVLRII
jgi:23S rRNA (cytosine1962-C5)-methyltransferase